MGYLVNLLITLVCINYCMSVLGYTSAYDNIINSWMEDSAAGGGNQVTLSGDFVGSGSVAGVSSIAITFILACLAGLGLTIIAGFFGSGFSVIYFLPAFTSIFILDLILRITGFLNDPTIPNTLGTFIFSIIGVVAIVIIISFIRGSEP